jgi:hypothetical protein
MPDGCGSLASDDSHTDDRSAEAADPKDAIVALRWSTGLRGFERWKRSGVGQSMDDQISDGAATRRHGWLGRSASWA